MAKFSTKYKIVLGLIIVAAIIVITMTIMGKFSSENFEMDSKKIFSIDLGKIISRLRLDEMAIRNPRELIENLKDVEIVVVKRNPPVGPEPVPYIPEPTPEPVPYIPEPSPYIPEPTPEPTPEPVPYIPEPTPEPAQTARRYNWARSSGNSGSCCR
jgi:hypothetical protein